MLILLDRQKAPTHELLVAPARRLHRLSPSALLLHRRDTTKGLFMLTLRPAL